MHGIIRIYLDEDHSVALSAAVRNKASLSTVKSGETCYHIVFKSRRQAQALFRELHKILERTDARA